MSNKVLAYILIAAVIVAAAGFVLWRIKGNRQEKLSAESQNQEQQVEQTNPNNNTEANAACQREFDQEKLNSAKVDIKDRVVEMDVTGFGKIQIELYDKDAPKTVENFLRLVNAGYYDCLTIHRVAKGFVIQGGDPTGTGGGGDSAFGGEFADELNPETESYKEGYKHGVIAMANRGADTNTSQFFIMLGDVSLPHSYTIFGKVGQGLDVVDKIGQVEITPQLGPTDGKPVVPVVVEKAVIVK